MTLDELRALDDPMITPVKASKILGCAPYSINVQARTNPEALGFPVCVIGTRVKIPRLAFIRWLEGRGAQ